MSQTLPVLVRTRGDGRTVTVRHARITFTATTAETGGRFELYDVTLDADAAPLRRHVHLQMDELIVVTAGEVEAIVGDRLLQLRAGTTLFIPRGTPHGWTNRGPAPATLLLHYSPSGHREQYFERLSRLSGGALPPTADQLDDLGRRFDEIPAG